MNSRINTFIFDCFGVIYSGPFVLWYNENKLKYGFVDDDKLNDIYKEYDLGNLSESDVAEYFSKYKGITSTKEEIQEQIDNYLKLNTELINIIKTLKAKGFKTALLSNGNTAYFERAIYPTYPEFKNLFDEIVISSEVKMVKPDPEIYIHTLEKIGSKPEESLFIDDRKINVDTAVNLGINGFVYTDNDSFVDYLKSLGINLDN